MFGKATVFLQIGKVIFAALWASMLAVGMSTQIIAQPPPPFPSLEPIAQNNGEDIMANPALAIENEAYDTGVDIDNFSVNE